ncbi:DUF397 domain-containing protein [Umezawaea sp. NPDC059074]|uniref:DUF397 domain-containing protein n=1 Tax=Umezawaea sp. NPDC059074 TaxID=3346716 RepID=UPI00367FFDCE
MSNWRKSSYSANQNDCVEVRGTLDAVRDSKNPAGPALRVSRAKLGAFLTAVKDDRLK